MARLDERLSFARAALATLDEVLGASLPPAVKRDAAIMRFVYSSETIWRALQLYLREIEGTEVGTPKACMRAARRVGLYIG